MNSNIFSFSIVIFLFSCFALATESKTVSAATELAQYLNQYMTFQAQFTQQTFDAHRRLLQRSQGTVMLMRPGRFRWNTMRPSHQIVVTDGKVLWVYDPDLRQATRQLLSSNYDNPAQLLSGRADVLLKQFQVTVLKKMRNTTVFQLKPKEKNEPFQLITMIFSDGVLRELHVENSLNQTNLFIFTHVQLNTHLDSNLFYFKPPANIDVL